MLCKSVDWLLYYKDFRHEKVKQLWLFFNLIYFTPTFYTAQKMKSSIKDFFSKCFHADLVTFTEEILNGKLHFLCSAIYICRENKFSDSFRRYRNEILTRNESVFCLDFRYFRISLVTTSIENTIVFPWS